MDEDKKIKPPRFIGANDCGFRYCEKSTPLSGNLDFLTYGVYEIGAGVSSSPVCHSKEEALLFCLDGEVIVAAGGSSFRLSHYDVLYIPMGVSYDLSNVGHTDAKLIVCRAKAEKSHQLFHGSWEKFSKDETRIRHLDGKDVYLMFDVGEKADRLIAGYTIYKPYTRAYPAHNHTDQEEIYIFTKGKGAMEAYKDEKSKTFVTSVGEMDAVSIPVLNYHPVFSQEEELHFIWCIAGERYWVGDKNKDFMKADSDTLTT
ncbi:MAG: 5-deoxy-glucuronate isomerase [Victivallales bacterium]